jgi:REP element-mobilizing transposase RayT
MARPQRIEFAGALYHVSAKGEGGGWLFHDAEDAERLLTILGQVCRRFEWAVMAYCLLPDHFELVVETRRPSLSEGMRRLSGLYGQAFNRRHGRHGPVFQGRFKAVLVDRELYLAEVCREVLRAPVEAGLAAQARDWRWSSCRAMLKGATPDWLAHHTLLRLFSDDPESASVKFTAFVEIFLSGSDPWSDRRDQIFLGSEGFVEQVREQASRVRESFGLAAEEARKPLAWFAEHYADPHEAMARAHLDGGYSQPVVAAHFGVHYSTVSRAATRRATQAAQVAQATVAEAA